MGKEVLVLQEHGNILRSFQLMLTYPSWLIELAILLGILGTSALICFIADFIVSLYGKE